MCSVNEEDIDIADLKLGKKDKKDLKDSSCKKCSQEKASVVLRMKDPYCRDCFLKYTTHKFRATLGKSKLVRPNDRIILASSGSQSSLSLLHLVAGGLSEKNNKRFLFSAVVVYIDEGAVTGFSRTERLETIRTIAKQSEDLGFSFYAVQLSNSLNLHSLVLHKVNLKEQRVDLNENEIIRHDETLISLFSLTKTLTSKDDLLTKLRLNLLRATAKELDCNKILMADNGSQLAVKLITNVSIGRGAHLPLDVGFCDVRDPALMILRPLKEFMGKEIAYYCVYNKLNAVALPSFSTKTSTMASISRLTEEFLFGLQEDFPSTLSAIIKTGDKLTINVEGNERCTLCKVALDHQNRQCSSEQATIFSQGIVDQICTKDSYPCGSLLAQDVGTESPNENASAEGCVEMGRDNEKPNLRDHLCYGCHIIVNDMCDAGALLHSLLHISPTEEKSVTITTANNAELLEGIS